MHNLWPIGFGFSTGEDAADLLPEINESFFTWEKTIRTPRGGGMGACGASAP